MTFNNATRPADEAACQKALYNETTGWAEWDQRADERLWTNTTRVRNLFIWSDPAETASICFQEFSRSVEVALASTNTAIFG